MTYPTPQSWIKKDRKRNRWIGCKTATIGRRIRVWGIRVDKIISLKFIEQSTIIILEEIAHPKNPFSQDTRNPTIISFLQKISNHKLINTTMNNTIEIIRISRQGSLINKLKIKKYMKMFILDTLKIENQLPNIRNLLMELRNIIICSLKQICRWMLSIGILFWKILIIICQRDLNPILRASSLCIGVLKVLVLRLPIWREILPST